jgi:UDP-glucuronate 4-epimerase
MNRSNQTVLVTGAAGFIGRALSRRLLDEGGTVIGVDNLNDYYDVSLKQARLDTLNDERFTFVKTGVEERGTIQTLFAEHRFDVVVHLAAQAGVRFSIDHPDKYIDANLVGFGNILEGCRHQNTPHLVYASSSSVYGTNTDLPFAESQSVDHPISLYAATKKANELMAHTYSHLFRLPTTGLRFFTVYGPWGRPDMSYYKFTKAALAGQPIDVYNHGKMRRDFTYIDDIVDGIVKVMGGAPKDTAVAAPYKIYNIGNNRSENLVTFIEILEKALGITIAKNLLPMQPGDVKDTAADIRAIAYDFGFAPTTSIEKGLPAFVSWYLDFYHCKSDLTRSS